MPRRIACRVGLALGLGLAAVAAHLTLAEGRPPHARTPSIPFGAAVVEAVRGAASQTRPDPSDLDLVPVFLHVVDRNRKPVSDLAREDFTVVEDGVAQTIRYFSAQSFAPGAPQPGPALVAGELAPLMPQGSRLFVFALGSGKLEETSKTITELVSFVRTRLLPQDHVAVVAYGRAIEFSTDHQRLAEVLERFRRSHEDVDFEVSLQMGPTGMAALYGTRVLPRKLQTRIEQLLFGPGGRTPTPTSAETLDHTTFATLSLDDFMVSSAVTAQDQGNLLALLEYLRHFQGSKHLLFVTERGLLWPAEESDRTLAGLANEGRVSIHTLQVGGLPTAERGRELESTLQMARSFGSLRTMSELTGGLSSITDSSRTALDTLDTVTRSGYLLGYQPSNKAWDGRYRTIEVRVKRPDATVLHRHGYRREQVPAGFDRRGFISGERLRAGGAFRREIGDIKVKVSAAVRAGELNVEGTVNLSKVKLELIDGLRVGRLKIGVFCLDSGSNPLGAQVRELPIKAADEQFRQFERNGMPYSIRVPFGHGTSNVRVVVYDFGSDRVGRADTTLR